MLGAGPFYALVVAAFVFVLSRIVRRKPSMPRPPGPPRLPLIGNLLDMPPDMEWLKYDKWSRKYGDMVSLNVLGQPMVILSNLKTANYLLDKKSIVSCDRPDIPMLRMSGFSPITLIQNYGVDFKHSRRLIHKSIGSESSLSRFYPLQSAEIRRFLKRLLAFPEHPTEQSLYQCSHFAASAILLRSCYGYSIVDNDPQVAAIETVMRGFVITGIPTAFWVNFAPILTYLPSWFPGTKWKALARQLKHDIEAEVDRPFHVVRQQMNGGKEVEFCYTADLLNEGEDDFFIKWTASTLYGAGSDALVASSGAFYKAMILHPEIQDRAQAEIDLVVGTDRLPTMADRSSLPYIEALLLEVYRWHSVVPLGFPHRLMEDEIVDGYFLQAGTVVLVNSWKISQDPNIYPDPHVFDPTRFLPSEGKPMQQDPRAYYFGHGRRMCAGRLFAQAALFEMVATSLAAFNVSTYIDENGVPHPPVAEQVKGQISHQSRFKCTIKPRSARAEALVRECVEE